MILLTGATGTVGSALLSRLTARGAPVRCLVRDPRRLGPERVRVQIALGDLGEPSSFRHALRGVSTVVHAAASIRDQPRAAIEETNALATLRLVSAAERSGAERFVLFSAIGAGIHSTSRFMRSKSLAERAVESSGLSGTVLAPSIVYSPGDPWLRLLERLSYLPVVPVPGSGRALYQPIFAGDVAECALAVLDSDSTSDGEEADGTRRFELAGPEILSHEAIVALVLRAARRPRRRLNLPMPLVKAGLGAVERLAGPAAFATPDEAELLDVPMTTARGTADAERLGVRPRAIREVLGVA